MVNISIEPWLVTKQITNVGPQREREREELEMEGGQQTDIWLSICITFKEFTTN